MAAVGSNRSLIWAATRPCCDGVYGCSRTAVYPSRRHPVDTRQSSALRGFSSRQRPTSQGRANPDHPRSRLDFRRLTVTAATPANSTGGEAQSRVGKLRELMASGGILKGPCCHDGLSARLIERAGFDFAFMSGFCTSAARLGAPDAGLLSYYEMVDQGRYVNEATESLPIIGDGDTGYGNAMNVKRTVKGYAAAGFAGILIEDQVWPKSCGHVGRKQVVGRDEAVARIRAAADARDEGSDIVILARTDARQAVSLEEALARAEAFAEAGADVLFIDALESREEMEKFCNLGGVAAGKPKMANMLEGGGKTPILPPEDLEDMGFALVAYPMSLLAVSVRAMELALTGLRQGRIPGPDAMPSFKDLQEVVGFPEYFEEAGRYAVDGAAAGRAMAPTEAVAMEGGSKDASSSLQEEDTGDGRDAKVIETEMDVEVEVLPIEQDVKRDTGYADMPLLRGRAGAGGQRQARFFRIRIADKRTDMVKLETRLPALFVDRLETVVPQLSGMDLSQLLRMAKGDEEWDSMKPLAEFESGDTDIIQLWLE